MTTQSDDSPYVSSTVPEVTPETIGTVGEELVALSPPQFLSLCRRIVSDTVPGADQIPEDIWEFEPWGPRLVVFRCPTEQTWGKIIIPDNAKEAPAAGWVISAGNMVCTPTSRLVSVCPYDNPIELIGRKVIFNKYAGVPLVGNAKEDEFGERGRVIEMNVADIHGVMNSKDSRGDSYDISKIIQSTNSSTEG